MHQSSNLYSSTSEKNSRHKAYKAESLSSPPKSKDDGRATERGASEAEKPHQSTSRSGQSLPLLERKVRADWTDGRMSESKPPSEEGKLVLLVSAAAPFGL